MSGVKRAEAETKDHHFERLPPLSEPARSPDRTASAIAGSRFHANPLRLSETDGDVAARRLAGKHEAGLPTVPRRRIGATDEEEGQESGPGADQACRGELFEPTVEHGLRE
jgi:hypothetical protein